MASWLELVRLLSLSLGFMEAHLNFTHINLWRFSATYLYRTKTMSHRSRQTHRRERQQQKTNRALFFRSARFPSYSTASRLSVELVIWLLNFRNFVRFIDKTESFEFLWRCSFDVEMCRRGRNAYASYEQFGRLSLVFGNLGEPSDIRPPWVCMCLGIFTDFQSERSESVEKSATTQVGEWVILKPNWNHPKQHWTTSPQWWTINEVNIQKKMTKIRLLRRRFLS